MHIIMKGDELLCIDAETPRLYTEGEVYTVLSVSKDRRELILQDDGHDEHPWGMDKLLDDTWLTRFVPAEYEADA